MKGENGPTMSERVVGRMHGEANQLNGDPAVGLVGRRKEARRAPDCVQLEASTPRR